jgi:hypothetical protein
VIENLMIRLKSLLAFFLVCFGTLPGQQYTLTLSLDGPDPDDRYGPFELIRFGQMDHLGTTIYGSDFAGAQGRRLGSMNIFDDSYQGALYEFSPNTGGNNPLTHRNASLAIKVESPGSWQLAVSVQKHGDPSVRTDQLLFKEDRQREYTPFSQASRTIARGGGGIHHLYYDLALRVEPDDEPGNYGWQIIYVIIEY